MLTNMEANSLVRGLVFIVQKSRSDLTEGLGDDEAAQSLLADLHPLFFGEKNVLPQLIKWQERCAKSGVIAGADLFNFTKLLDMDQGGHAALGLLGIYGYTQVSIEGPDIGWFSMTWPYLTA